MFLSVVAVSKILFLFGDPLLLPLLLSFLASICLQPDVLRLIQNCDNCKIGLHWDIFGDIVYEWPPVYFPSYFRFGSGCILNWTGLLALNLARRICKTILKENPFGSQAYLKSIIQMKLMLLHVHTTYKKVIMGKKHKVH